jgi:hypothetical protein
MYAYILQIEINDNWTNALEHAKKLARHINELHPKNKGRLAVEQFGHRGRLYWIQNFSSLDEMDRVQNHLSNNEDYKMLINHRTNVVLRGKDKVLRFIDHGC